jgi:hypothetical protein
MDSSVASFRGQSVGNSDGLEGPVKGISLCTCLWSPLAFYLAGGWSRFNLRARGLQLRMLHIDGVLSAHR